MTTRTPVSRPDAATPPPFSFVREELRRVWSDVRGGNLSPARIAASVVLGTFIGCLPIFGLHLPVVLLLCLRLRLDGALAYLAANISNPFMAPLLITGQVQLGAYLIEGRVPAVSELGTVDALTRFPLYLIVGAPIVGLGLGLGLGLVAYVLTRLKRSVLGETKREPYKLPANAPPWVAAVERVAARYSGDESASAKAQFNYVRIKLLTDPIAKLIADIAGDAQGALGRVFDVGTGRGQLPILLLELERATAAAGCDWDRAKIQRGVAAAALAPALEVSLSAGDARTTPIEASDTVLLVDLLHYFTVEEQDALLRRAAQAVLPGGRLIVREADTERGWRSRVTLLEERIFTFLRFNRGERVKFRAARELSALLESEGLSVEVRPAWGKTPFSNVLILGQRACSESVV